MSAFVQHPSEKLDLLASSDCSLLWRHTTCGASSVLESWSALRLQRLIVSLQCSSIAWGEERAMAKIGTENIVKQTGPRIGWVWPTAQLSRLTRSPAAGGQRTSASPCVLLATPHRIGARKRFRETGGKNVQTCRRRTFSNQVSAESASAKVDQPSTTLLCTQGAIVEFCQHIQLFLGTAEVNFQPDCVAAEEWNVSTSLLRR